MPVYNVSFLFYTHLFCKHLEGSREQQGSKSWMWGKPQIGFQLFFFFFWLMTLGKWLNHTGSSLYFQVGLKTNQLQDVISNREDVCEAWAESSCCPSMQARPGTLLDSGTQRKCRDCHSSQSRGAEQFSGLKKELLALKTASLGFCIKLDLIILLIENSISAPWSQPSAQHDTVDGADMRSTPHTPPVMTPCQTHKNAQ